MSITLRNWILVGAKEFLSGRSLSILESPLGVVGVTVFAISADARMDQTAATRLRIASIVVNLVVLAMLIAFPTGDPMVRLLLAAAAACCLAGATFKVRSR